MGWDEYPDGSSTWHAAFGYETRDDGDRVHFESGMEREPSEGKTRYDLLIPRGYDPEVGGSMLERWAELLTRGAGKYEPRNWELANSEQELERFKESAFRHFMQWFLDYTDEDHAAAVFFNIQGYEYTATRMANE